MDFEQVISRLQKTIMRNARTSPVQMSWMTGVPYKNMYLDMAKGDLRRSKKLTEEEAIKLIQRQSMNFRKSMRRKAEAVLLAGELDQRVEKHRG